MDTPVFQVSELNSVTSFPWNIYCRSWAFVISLFLPVRAPWW